MVKNDSSGKNKFSDVFLFYHRPDVPLDIISVVTKMKFINP